GRAGPPYLDADRFHVRRCRRRTDRRAARHPARARRAAQPADAGGGVMTLAPPRRPEEPRRPAVASKTLAHAAVLTIAVTLAGSLLGLVRDLLLARYFGANGATDAFLVAWTVPETAFPLVVEGALAFLLVPLFSRALAAVDPGAVDPGAAVRDLVTASAPRILGVLVVASATVAAGAPIR